MANIYKHDGQILYAVYRNFDSGRSATSSGSGSGCISDDPEDVLIGIASSRANAAQLILKDAYDRSAQSDVYSAVVSELQNYPDGVDSVSVTLSSMWSIEPIKVDELLPDAA